MKKIMFNDRYGLTQAVLDGRKTMTRRIIPGCYKIPRHEFEKIAYTDYVLSKSRYQVGDVIAIAQAYKDVFLPGFTDNLPLAAVNNKMFVKAELMPHQIQITDIQVQCLRDISIEDCFKEGIQEFASCSECGGPIYTLPEPNDDKCYFHPREAFEAIINGVCPRLTWESNPWVFVYTFKLIR